jgi:nucleotide-binding universal stress UspA family protein
MSGWKRIGCAVDFSEPSRLALQRAAALAVRDDAELWLLHVYEVPQPAGELLVAAVDLTGPAAAEAEQKMAAWMDDAMRLRGGPVRQRILAGQPALEVTQAAREAGCDLLVVGTHGRTGVKRLVLGSVAERIVREAGCDVLVARG